MPLSFIPRPAKKDKRTIFATLLTIGVSVLLISGIVVAATTIGSNISTDGNLTVLGTVGIGTSTPSARFSFTGDGIGATRAFVLADSGNTERFTILNNGNVGVGTASPAEKLDVKGNISLLASSALAPTQLSSVTSFGARRLFVVGRYAYFSEGGGNIRIYDVSNPSSPASVSSTATGCNNLVDIYVAGRYAYIGCRADATMKIYDVSNPKTPAFMSSIGMGSGVWAVYVAGKYAYVTDSVGNLNIIDVANPASPQLVYRGVPTGGGAPFTVWVAGRYAYVGTTAGGLKVIDISNPANPTLAGSLNITSSDFIVGIHVVGRYAYIANQNTSQLYIADVSNPASPSLVSTTALDGDAYVIKVSGRYLYTGNYSVNTVQIFDVSNPASPAQVARLNTQAGPFGLQVAGRYLYVSGDGGFRIYDIGGMEATSLLAHSVEAGFLQVRNNAMFSGDLTVSGGINTAGGVMADGPVGITASSTAAAQLCLSATCPASAVLSVTQQLTGDIFHLYGSSGRTLTVTNAGNVGIGTTSPWGFFSVSPNGVSGPEFIVGSSTATHLMVTNGGQVGIGASPTGISATTDLLVIDGSNPGIVVNTNTGNGALNPRIYFRNAFQVQTASIVNSGPIAFGANGASSEHIRITQAGSIGIGTTTPAKLLSVHGNALMSGTLTVEGTLTATSSALLALNGGSVGIGATSSPAALLSLVQSANTKLGGLMLAATDGDTRGVYMNTSGVLSFEGGDGGTINTASLNAAGAWTNASDVRYKEAIQDLSYGLETILKLKPRSYTMKGTHLKQTWIPI